MISDQFANPQKDTALGQALLAALCYFDLFRYPLTTEELRRYRYGGPPGPVTPAEVEAALARLPVSGRNGFWCLRGSEDDREERQRRYRLAEPKFRRARWFVNVLSCLPSVRMAAVCNSLALSNAHEESDIDLFVVVRPGTIWTTRLLATGLLAALGLRPDEITGADRLCLSFLVTEEAMNLCPMAIPDADPYLIYWIATLVPLYDAGGVFGRFMAANAWIGEALPGLVSPQVGHRRTAGHARSSWSLPLLKAMEGPARRLQWRLFPRTIREQANQTTDVMVSDQVLKFHVRDGRRQIAKAYQQKCHQLAK